MLIRSTPHAHTTYVDGNNSAEEMVLAAIDAGFHSFGFSEHGTQTFDAHANLAEENIPKYIAEVRALQKKYAGQIRVHLGVERDVLSSAKREDYEYVLGSTHYFWKEDNWYAVDGELEPLIECREKYFGGDGVKLAQEYFVQLAEYIVDYRPEIVGHFDLVRKRNAEGALYNGSDAKLIRTQREALEAIRTVDPLLELNTGGMARGYLPTPYPELHLLKFWHDLGGRVIVGSDTHSIKTVDFAFSEMPALLKEAGFKTFWELGAEGEDQFVERPLD